MKNYLPSIPKISIAVIIVASIVACSQKTSLSLWGKKYEFPHVSGDIVSDDYVGIEFIPGGKIALSAKNDELIGYKRVRDDDGLTRLHFEESLFGAEALVIVDRGNSILLFNETSTRGTLLSKFKEFDLQKTAELKNDVIQNEGRTRVRSINRGQQAYYLENNRFTTQIDNLGFSVEPETAEYSYSIMMAPQAAIAVAQAKRKGIKSYIGVVQAGGSLNTAGVLCEVGDSSTQARELAGSHRRHMTSSHRADLGADLACPEGSSAL